MPLEVFKFFSQFLHSKVNSFRLLCCFIRTASQNEVKDAYRKLAMALHPDRHNGCEKKAGEFKKATEAYTVLSGEFLAKTLV